LRIEIHKGLLEYLSEASQSEEHTKLSAEAPRRFEDAVIRFGPNQTGKLGDIEQFKAKMVTVPSGDIHKLEYSYRLTSYSVAIPSTEFGSRDKTVTVHMGKRASTKESSPSVRLRRSISDTLGQFVDWWKQPFLWQSKP
jgi:hypothetical protein